MSEQHLSSADISALLAGAAPDSVAAHAGECGECRVRVGEHKGLLDEFRAEVRSVAVAPASAWRPRAARPVWPRWAMAGALAAALLVTVVWRTPAPVAADPAGDWALLEQVDAQLARRVPSAMEPLAALALNSSELDN